LSQQHELLDSAIKQVGNRYVATMLVAKRIRQLYHGAPSYVERREDESYFSVVLREIAEGHLILQERPHDTSHPSEPPAPEENGANTTVAQSTETPVETD
jgi:DNA-directed RNA polymerase omega subunit